MFDEHGNPDGKDYPQRVAQLDRRWLDAAYIVIQEGFSWRNDSRWPRVPDDLMVPGWVLMAFYTGAEQRGPGAPMTAPPKTRWAPPHLTEKMLGWCAAAPPGARLERAQALYALKALMHQATRRELQEAVLDIINQGPEQP